MDQSPKKLNNDDIDRALEADLVEEFLNPSPGAGADATNTPIPTSVKESVLRVATPVAEEPEFLGPEAKRLKRSSAETQLRNHLEQLGRLDRFIVGMAMRGAHRKASLELTDALVRVSVETAKFKIGMGSQIIRAELLIEFLRTQPRLAAEVSRLCHETRIVLSEQLFKLTDEIYALRNSRLAQIAEQEENKFLTREDAEEQRELLKQVVAEELIDKWSRYSMVFKNISRHFVRTLATALEHVQNAGAMNTM